MADSHPRFAELPLRQKMAVIIFIIFVSFVILKVVGMFRSGGSGSGGGAGGVITAEKPAAPMASTAPKASLPAGKQLALNTKVPPPSLPTSPPPPVVKAPPSIPVSLSKGQPLPDTTLPPTSLTLQQDQAQTKYVTALNELQMLKIQKEIAETSQAIVAAKLATVTAEKSITDVLSAPAKSEEEAPPRRMAPSATNNAPPGYEPAPLGAGGPSGPATYSVHSVSMQQDQWHAVVKFKDSFYDVSVGDMLPPDGSIVKAIDQRGITLETAGFEQKVPLTITTTVPETEKSGSHKS